MDKSIFRKKSIDEINSPEELNGYLKITNPPVWFALAAILLILIGAIVWAGVSKIEAKAGGVVVATDSSAICYASEQDIGRIEIGTIVRIGDEEFEVTSVAESSVIAEDKLSDYGMSLAGFNEWENLYALELSHSTNPGNYACEIILEVVSPITYIFNATN